MILKDWLVKNNIAPYKFAKSIGMAAASLYKVLGGKHRMSRRYALEVEKATNGDVCRCEAIWPEESKGGSPCLKAKGLQSDT